MTEDPLASREDVYRFIREEIDTIPHLEALLLIWNSRPRRWCLEELAGELYIAPAAAHSVVQGLVRRGLLSADSSEGVECYTYNSTGRQHRLMEALSLIYRRELIPISRLIHSKGTEAMRNFADAFRFTKDREKNRE